MALSKAQSNWLAPRNYIKLHRWEALGTGLVNLLIFSLLFIYLFPTLYMVSVSFMEGAQLRDRYAPPYPAQQLHYEYDGKERLVYKVPFADGTTRELALAVPGRTSSQFIDPKNPEAGLIDWEGSWRTLPGAYEFHMTWDNFDLIFSRRFPSMLRNTLVMAVISLVGVLISSIVVAYGFARFPLPGGNLIFYLMIATVLIPENITLIPTYYVFVNVLDWNGTWLPILLPFFFGNAVYIFLLRQNFKSIPKELEEAAVIDGAGPIRTLFSIVLPQSWPVVITVSILHFFYIWNETRQAALYLGIRPDLIPLSYGVQNFQSLSNVQNQLQASALIVMIVPLIVLLFSQRYFMRGVIVTGIEK